MVPSATTSCVRVTEVEDALAICRDQDERRGSHFAIGMEDHHGHYEKSQASAMCENQYSPATITPTLSNPKPSPTASDLVLVKLRVPL